MPFTSPGGLKERDIYSQNKHQVVANQLGGRGKELKVLSSMSYLTHINLTIGHSNSELRKDGSYSKDLKIISTERFADLGMKHITQECREKNVCDRYL